MIGSDEVFAPILDPFHRAAEPERGDTGKHVFGVELAAHPEAAAGMAFVKMHRGGRAAEHARECVSIPMGHFGGAVEFEHVAAGIVARDGAAGLEWHRGVSADFKFERYG